MHCSHLPVDTSMAATHIMMLPPRPGTLISKYPSHMDLSGTSSAGPKETARLGLISAVLLRVIFQMTMIDWAGSPILNATLATTLLTLAMNGFLNRTNCELKSPDLCAG